MSVAEASQPYTDRDWLKEQYIRQAKPPKQIAEECGVPAEAVTLYVARFQLQAYAPEEYRSKEFLQREYVEKDKTAGQIAEENDVVRSTIGRWLAYHEVTK